MRAYLSLDQQDWGLLPGKLTSLRRPAAPVPTPSREPVWSQS